MSDTVKTTIAAVTVVIAGVLGFVTLNGTDTPCSLVPTTYAQVDAKGIVKTIIIADECFILSGAVGDSASWVVTDYSVPEKAANINGKYDSTSDTFITKQDVKKYGDTVKATDLIANDLIMEVSTSTEI